VSLPHGFKANAERESLRLRSELGLARTDALDLTRLAEHLEVEIVSAGDLIDVTRLEELERIQAYSFSAATFKVKDRTFVVTSPLRPAPRQASDVAHELSHLRLKHELSEIREINGVPFRTCRPDEEEQATSFGGTLLLHALVGRKFDAAAVLLPRYAGAMALLAVTNALASYGIATHRLAFITPLLVGTVATLAAMLVVHPALSVVVDELLAGNAAMLAGVGIALGVSGARGART